MELALGLWSSAAQVCCGLAWARRSGQEPSRCRGGQGPGPWRSRRSGSGASPCCPHDTLASTAAVSRERGISYGFLLAFLHSCDRSSSVANNLNVRDLDGDRLSNLLARVAEITDREPPFLHLVHRTRAKSRKNDPMSYDEEWYQGSRNKRPWQELHRGRADAGMD